MQKILLCDDDPFFLSVGCDVIGQLIAEERLDAEVVCMARSGEEAEAFLTKNSGDYLVFLDLDFGKGSLNGIDIAAKLRRIEQQMRIVFTTNHHELALDVLKSGVEPFGFLEKTADILTLREGFRRYIKMAMRVAAVEDQPVSLDVIALAVGGGETVTIRKCDIVYIESEKNMSHGITFHTSGGSRLTVVGTLDSEEERMGSGFFRVHRSYLVNQTHIIGLKDGYIRLSTQEEIPCAFRKQSEVKKWITRK